MNLTDAGQPMFSESVQPLAVVILFLHTSNYTSGARPLLVGGPWGPVARVAGVAGRPCASPRRLQALPGRHPKNNTILASLFDMIFDGFRLDFGSFFINFRCICG